MLGLPDDALRSIDEGLVLPAAEPEALFAAPPALVTAAPPGEHCFVASATGPSPEPGRYVTVCFIPTGADPQAYFAALEANPATS